MGESALRTVCHEAVVCGVPTKFMLSAYGNRLFVLVTQADNFGTLVCRPSPLSAHKAQHEQLWC